MKFIIILLLVLSFTQSQTDKTDTETQFHLEQNYEQLIERSEITELKSRMESFFQTVPSIKLTQIDSKNLNFLGFQIDEIYVFNLKDKSDFQLNHTDKLQYIRAQLNKVITRVTFVGLAGVSFSIDFILNGGTVLIETKKYSTQNVGWKYTVSNVTLNYDKLEVDVGIFTSMVPDMLLQAEFIKDLVKKAEDPIKKQLSQLLTKMNFPKVLLPELPESAANGIEINYKSLFRKNSKYSFGQRKSDL